MRMLRAVILAGVLGFAVLSPAAPAALAAPLPNDCPACGGFAGLTCPPGFVCMDDPRDECDPANGGADCMGVCVLEGLVQGPAPQQGTRISIA
ncbi:hypothetical protein [Streptomyces sp. NBC_01304]|uniref:hypothetical protein n=1 Tax=Streptomyces sp. NBC_01304 TaxID=2903818 RepID=UPI002E1357F7|nr:hypothetical protein OG430_44035 [Streptomyces sp. NBC_01304]